MRSCVAQSAPVRDFDGGDRRNKRWGYSFGRSFGLHHRILNGRIMRIRELSRWCYHFLAAPELSLSKVVDRHQIVNHQSKTKWTMLDILHCQWRRIPPETVFLPAVFKQNLLGNQASDTLKCGARFDLFGVKLSSIDG